MTIRVLAVILALIAAFGTGWYLGKGDPATAYAQTTYREYKIDSAWGELKGAIGGSLLLFEDKQGNVRIVNTVLRNPTTSELSIEMLLTRE